MGNHIIDAASTILNTLRDGLNDLFIFSKKFNEAMAEFEQLPLEFHAEEDPDWEEYQEMKETEIAVDEE